MHYLRPILKRRFWGQAAVRLGLLFLLGWEMGIAQMPTAWLESGEPKAPCLRDYFGRSGSWVGKHQNGVLESYHFGCDEPALGSFFSSKLQNREPSDECKWLVGSANLQKMSLDYKLMDKGKFDGMGCFPSNLNFQNANLQDSQFPTLRPTERVTDFRNNQYYDRKVRRIETYYTQAKKRKLISVKVFDSEGFILKQDSLLYDSIDHLSGIFHKSYSYNLDRTILHEVSSDSTSEYVEILYTKDRTFDGEGRLVYLKEWRQEWLDSIDYRYQYDNKSHIIATTIFYNGNVYSETITYDYNSLGFVSTESLVGKITTSRSYLYDSLGRLTHVIADGNCLEYLTYDERNQTSMRTSACKIHPVAMSMSSGLPDTEHFVYNSKGQLIAKDATISSKDPGTSKIPFSTMKYKYHSNGLLARFKLQGPFHVKFSRNYSGQITESNLIVYRPMKYALAQ